jgi:hypothetical protein
LPYDATSGGKAMSEPIGPFLTMAFFCEKALQEIDAVFTAVRIINNVNVEMSHEDLNKTHRLLMDLWMFVGFSSQAFEANRGLHLVAVSPSGKEMRLPETGVQPLFFSKEEHGSTARIQLKLGVEEMGTYWFKIYLEDRLMGQTPLTVKYLKTQSEQDAPSSKTEA